MEYKNQSRIWPMNLFASGDGKGEGSSVFRSLTKFKSITMQISLAENFAIPSSLPQNIVSWNWSYRIQQECCINSCLIPPRFHANDYQLTARCNRRIKLLLCCELRSGESPSLFQEKDISVCLHPKTTSGSDTKISVLCLIKFLSDSPGSC